MKILVLDTNFLMILYQHKVDIFSEIDRIVLEEYELIVPLVVVDELRKIQYVSSGSDKIAAKIALELIEKNNIKKIESDTKADEFLLKLASKNRNSIVCTNDKELKRKLTPVIKHIKGVEFDIEKVKELLPLIRKHSGDISNFYLYRI